MVMKTTLILAIFLIGCSSTSMKQPTPFVTGQEVQSTLGCQLLKNEVDEYNRTNPSATPKKADC